MPRSSVEIAQGNTPCGSGFTREESKEVDGTGCAGVRGGPINPLPQGRELRDRRSSTRIGDTGGKRWTHSGMRCSRPCTASSPM
ncbi:hypothetical protein DMX06_24695 [Pseudomonas mosselii]|nr:hypothetical protein DMX06_24695 [Pseudomonas mosselii]